MKTNLFLFIFLFPFLLGAQTGNPGNDTLQNEEPGYILPSPLQLVYISKKHGLNYQEKLTLDAGSLDRFSTLYTQCTALGIYQTDLAYCSLNEKTGLSKVYIKSVITLAEKLGMPTGDLEKRFKTNSGNEDSVMFILSEYQYKSDEYFTSQDKAWLISEIFAGAMVENLYLASTARHINSYTFENELADQYVIIRELIRYFEKFKPKEEPTPSVITGLASIMNLMGNIPGVKEMIDSDEPSSVKITPGKGQLTELCSTIRTVREMLVK